MLDVVAEALNQAAVEGGEREQDRDEPEAEVDRDDGDGEVAEEAEARPVEQTAAGIGLAGGEQVVHPVAVDDAEGEANLAAEVMVDALVVDEAVFEKADGREFDRQSHLEIVGWVQRVFMVFLVAGPERDRVVAGHEADEIEEERVQPFGAEDGAVAELVKAVEEEGVDRAVEVERDDEQRERAEVPGVERRCGGEADDRQVAEGLSEAKQVAALIEAGEQVAVDRGAVPVDALGSG